MPELPEVETITCGLRPVLTGQKVADMWLGDKGLRDPFPAGLVDRVVGQHITHVSRRAKYIICDLDNGFSLALHLGMSGRIKILPVGSNLPREKHDHFEMKMQNGERIILNDTRRFGMLFDVRTDQIDVHPRFSSLGPEPLSDEFNQEYLHEALSGKKSPIKVAIMDQRLVVGVGNIYASEALYRARISPLRDAGSLTADEVVLFVSCIKDVLCEAIEAGGTTLKDHRTVEGGLGYFQQNLAVYGREKLACPQCICNPTEDGGIQKIVQAGRSTFYCRIKQV